MTTTLHFHLQSYGGYMAGMVGSSETGIYSTAISQSPVTDWHYYGIENYCTTYDSIENEKKFMHHIAMYSDGIVHDTLFCRFHLHGEVYGHTR